MVHPQGLEPQLAGYKPDALTIELWVLGSIIVTYPLGLEPRTSSFGDLCFPLNYRYIKSMVSVAGLEPAPT